VFAPRDCIVHGAARACAGAVRGRCSRSACRDCYNANIRSELETIRFKLIQRALVLKEYDLTKSFAARLKSDTDFSHADVTDIAPVHVDPAFAKGPADSDCTLADGWKYRVTIT